MRLSSRRPVAALGLWGLGLLLFGQAHAGELLERIRAYDLNDYALGIAVSSSQSPYAGAANATIVFPFLTSFQHSAFTQDWLLVRGENLGLRFVTASDWEFGVVGRLQTLGLGMVNSDDLRGLKDRNWSVEAGPLIGWRGSPVHVQFRSYWEIPDRHGGATSELEFSLPRQLTRGFFVPAIRLAYLSAEYADHYFGVAEQEATPGRPPYRPGAARNLWGGFTLGYALAPRWLLTTSFGLEFLDDSVKASPLVERGRLWSARVGLAYNANLFAPRNYPGAQQRDSFEIRLGAFNGGIDTRVSRNASGVQTREWVDLEDLLGAADRETILQLDAGFRIAPYHRLQLGYFSLARESMTILQRDLEFGDNVYLAGTQINSRVESTLLRLAYGYSLMRDQQKELGVMAGLSYFRFDTQIAAAGPGQTERLGAESPLPTVGVFAAATLRGQWRLAGDINLFALDFDRYRGLMGYLSLGMDRGFGNAVRAGIGYNFYGLRLQARDEDLDGRFDLRHQGPKLYVSVIF